MPLLSRLRSVLSWQPSPEPPMMDPGPPVVRIQIFHNFLSVFLFPIVFLLSLCQELHYVVCNLCGSSECFLWDSQRLTRQRPRTSPVSRQWDQKKCQQMCVFSHSSLNKVIQSNMGIASDLLLPSESVECEHELKIEEQKRAPVIPTMNYWTLLVLKKILLIPYY